MKNLTATTALVALMALPAFAQTTAPAQSGTTQTITEGTGTFGTDDLINRSLYASSADSVQNDRDDIGTINDLILTGDGKIVAIVLDIGTYFSIGARQVSVPIDQITLVADDNADGAMIAVLAGPADALEDLPELDRSDVNDQGLAFFSAGNTAVSSDQGLTEDAVTDAPAAPDTDSASESDLDADPAADDANLSAEARAALTASDLQGTSVFDMSGERIGEISDLSLADDGDIGQVIIDVGGFLGLGAKPVAVAIDDLQFTREEGGMTNTLRATTTITKSQFDTMQAWDG